MTLVDSFNKMVDNVFGIPSGMPQPIQPMMKELTTMDVSMSGAGVPTYDDYMMMQGMDLPRQHMTLKQIDALFEASDIAKIVLRTLCDEMFRNGIEVEAEFEYRCMECGKTFTDWMAICDECEGTVRTPSFSDRKRLEKWFKGPVNDFGETLMQVNKKFERDLDRFARAFCFCQKKYNFRKEWHPEWMETEGRKVMPLLSVTVEQIIRASPYWMKKIHSTYGNSRNEKGQWAYTCVGHRNEVNWMDLRGHYPCPNCGREMFLAEFYTEHAHHYDQKIVYYVKGEVRELTKFDGISPMFVIWTKLLTLYQMDKYIFKMFSLQRSPRGLLFIRGRQEHIQKSWMWMKAMSRENPNMVYPVAVDAAIGDKASSIAQYVDLAIDMGMIQYIEMREEYRRLLGMMYGVSPIYQGDLSTGGGLNNEGLQVTVTNRACEVGQSVFNDDLFPWIARQMGVEDLVWHLLPSEEKDEKSMIEREHMRLQNAQVVKQLGYDIELELGEDGLEFKVGEKQEQQPGMPGMPGLPGGGGQTPPPPGGDAFGPQQTGAGGSPTQEGEQKAFGKDFGGGPEMQKELRKELRTAPKNSIVAGEDYEADPSDSQKKTGNYEKPSSTFNGERVVIENPVGSTRKGKDKGGKAWENKMVADYGYILGLKGADKDHLDVFIKPGTEKMGSKIFIVYQVNPTTGEFDEHKVMFGYDSIDDAKKGYLANYEPGWKGLGDIVEMDRQQWEGWKEHLKTNKELEKEKKYVKTASEVPEGYTIRQGPKGGLYYDSEGKPSMLSEGMRQDLASTQVSTPRPMSQAPPGAAQLPEYIWNNTDRDMKEFLNKEVKHIETKPVYETGLTSVVSGIMTNSHALLDKYEVSGKALIYVNHEDPPAGIVSYMQDVMKVLNDYPGERVPSFVFTGKDTKYDFKWTTREGEGQDGTAAGLANTTQATIALINEKGVYTEGGPLHIAAHEVGHIAQKDLMHKEFNEADIFNKHECTGLQYLTSEKELDDWNEFIELMDQVRGDTPEKDFARDAIEVSVLIKKCREKGIELIGGKFRPLDNLQRTYDFVETYYQRVVDMGYGGRTSEQEIARARLAMAERKQEAKGHELFKKWNEVYEAEKWPGNKYADQSQSETFADFYAKVFKTKQEYMENYDYLNKRDNGITPEKAKWLYGTYFQKLSEEHPKKLDFFAKHVFKDLTKYRRAGNAKPEPEQPQPEQGGSA